ncbi:ryncolin-1-like [Asterias rubens]|uniref:ryncolin-1-like n=1 Tax=Asterias rubens TaxID=7604 RepID=UPI0014555BBF|nr:ryncolin-1-like [Asterias rubens]
MKYIVAVFMLVCLMIQYGQCERFTSTLYGATNRALLNHGFRWKTASSPVICGRDCSMDPQCASFNYQTDNYVCELNNVTRAQHPGNFIELQGSVYYDEKADTLSFIVSGLKSSSSCLELYQAGYRSNGIYTIFPTNLIDGLQVYCDMESDGGGWIVLQRRQNGSVDFYRNWTEYQSGFGDLQNEFWLGNDILRDLTGSGQWELRVDMEDLESNTAWAFYGEFAVTGDNYTLHVGSYDAQSTAGDSMTSHNGSQFSTKDQDNDASDSMNCAVRYKGAWWYFSCFHSNLNGEYFKPADLRINGHGITWQAWKSLNSLKKCSMKIRQVI